MTLLTLQRQITQLSRQRLELYARIRVHCPDETSLSQLEAINEEIYELTQRWEDELYAGELRAQGAAAVEEVERMMEEL